MHQVSTSNRIIFLCPRELISRRCSVLRAMSNRRELVQILEENGRRSTDRTKVITVIDFSIDSKLTKDRFLFVNPSVLFSFYRGVSLIQRIKSKGRQCFSLYMRYKIPNENCIQRAEKTKGEFYVFFSLLFFAFLSDEILFQFHSI